MDVPKFLKKAASLEIRDKLAALAASPDPASIGTLQEFLVHKDSHTFDKHVVPRLACMALLQKGAVGVRALAEILPKAPGSIYPTCILEALWGASLDDLTSSVSMTMHMPPVPPLVNALSSETILEARKVVNELVANSKSNPDLFNALLNFFYGQNHWASLDDKKHAQFRKQFFEIFILGTIKITRQIIEDFESLVSQELEEESYQRFLELHPALLDPLAAQVIPKTKLGIEFVTDFVIRRHDNKYLLVEIERPQDMIFTKSNDFTSRFTHGLGQVLDFQQWIDTHAEYARSHLPSISSPAGLLLIGRTAELNNWQKQKLHRFTVNSMALEILTFDGLAQRARQFCESIYS